MQVFVVVHVLPRYRMNLWKYMTWMWYLPGFLAQLSSKRFLDMRRERRQFLSPSFLDSLLWDFWTQKLPLPPDTKSSYFWNLIDDGVEIFFQPEEWNWQRHTLNFVSLTILWQSADPWLLRIPSRTLFSCSNFLPSGPATKRRWASFPSSSASEFEERDELELEYEAFWYQRIVTVAQNLCKRRRCESHLRSWMVFQNGPCLVPKPLTNKLCRQVQSNLSPRSC